jgi:hypothetical protein
MKSYFVLITTFLIATPTHPAATTATAAAQPSNDALLDELLDPIHGDQDLRPPIPQYVPLPPQPSTESYETAAQWLASYYLGMAQVIYEINADQSKLAGVSRYCQQNISDYQTQYGSIALLWRTALAQLAAEKNPAPIFVSAEGARQVSFYFSLLQEPHITQNRSWHYLTMACLYAHYCSQCPNPSYLPDAPGCIAQLHDTSLCSPESLREICRYYIRVGRPTKTSYEQLFATGLLPQQYIMAAVGSTSVAMPPEIANIICQYAPRILQNVQYFNLYDFVENDPNDKQFFTGISDLTGLERFVSNFCGSLQILNFKDNAITTLPAHEFVNLRGVILKMSFEDNQITHVPASVINGPSYGNQVLVLAGNPIRNVTEALCHALANNGAAAQHLQKLRILDMRRCPLSPEAYRDLTYACRQGRIEFFADKQKLLPPKAECTIL